MPLQVRGRSLTAVVLKVVGSVDEAFFGSLEAVMRQAPHFFANAPLVLDLEKAPDVRDKADFAKLVRALRARKLFAIGIQNATAEQGVAAFGSGLITLPGGRSAPLDRDPKPVAAETPAPADPPAETASPTGAAIVVTEPVRSGQRIFADGRDLVVVAPVSSGAELISTGNIHVYAALRGRALAGVNGDRNARIFCQNLGAELIAIAGLYRTSEDIEKPAWGQRVQAFLREDALCIDPLK